MFGKLRLQPVFCATYRKAQRLGTLLQDFQPELRYALQTDKQDTLTKPWAPSDLKFSDSPDVLTEMAYASETGRHKSMVPG